MKTISEVSALARISKRTLQYYDRIGLLCPSARSEAGYRLYSDADLERLQQILLFRELEFPLAEIRKIMHAPGYDRTDALQKQIEMLTLKKEHLENLITFARGVQMIGVKNMDFSAFDTKRLDEYCARAKELWAETPEMREYESRAKGRTPEDEQKLADALLHLFVEFGALKSLDAAAAPVQSQVKRLQDFITEHCYTCSDKILLGLGKMCSGGGALSESIDEAGGEGTALFVARAIDIYCAARS